jgi:hypothetical protein
MNKSLWLAATAVALSIAATAPALAAPKPGS